MSDRSGREILSSEYKEAIFFPIAEDEGQITYGAVIFVK